MGSDNYIASNIDSLVLNIHKINAVNNITVDGSVIVYGKNGTVSVDFGDLQNVGGSVTVTFEEIDGLFSADVIEGIAVVNVGGLKGNMTYHVTSIVYSGDDMHDGFIIGDENIVIEVIQATSNVTISDIVSVNYNDNVVINYNVVNKTEISVVVRDSDNNIITVDVDSSVDGMVVISGLGADKYTITIINAESNNYKGSSDIKSFDVLKGDVIISPVASSPCIVNTPVNVVFNLPTDIDVDKVSVSIDGIFTGFNVSDGICIVNFNSLSAGLHTVIVRLVGDINYDDAVGSLTFNVDKINPVIIINHELDNNSNIIISVDVEGATGLVNIVVNDIGHLVALNNQSRANYIMINPKDGNYSVIAKYLGDDNCNANVNNTNFTVGDGKPYIDPNVAFIDPDNDNSTVFSISLPNNATGNFTVFVDGEKYKTVPLVEGKANIDVGDLPEGTYNITMSYSDGNYDDMSKSSIIVINNTSPLPLDPISPGNPDEIFDVPSGNVNPPVFNLNLPSNATGNFTVSIGGNNYTVPVINGSACISIPDLASGSYEVVVSYSGDNHFSGLNKTATVNVSDNPIPVPSGGKKSTILTSKKKFTFKKSKRSKTKKFKFTLTSNGVKVNAVKVTFKLNKKALKAIKVKYLTGKKAKKAKKILKKLKKGKYAVKTKNGVVKLKLKKSLFKFKKGKGKLTATFKGDATYKGSSATVKVVMK